MCRKSFRSKSTDSTFILYFSLLYLYFITSHLCSKLPTSQNQKVEATSVFGQQRVYRNHKKNRAWNDLYFHVTFIVSENVFIWMFQPPHFFFAWAASSFRETNNALLHVGAAMNL